MAEAPTRGSQPPANQPAEASRGWWGEVLQSMSAAAHHKTKTGEAICQKTAFCVVDGKTGGRGRGSRAEMLRRSLRGAHGDRAPPQPKFSVGRAILEGPRLLGLRLTLKRQRDTCKEESRASCNGLGMHRVRNHSSAGAACTPPRRRAWRGVI